MLTLYNTISHCRFCGKGAWFKAAQKGPIENQGYAIMRSPIQNLPASSNYPKTIVLPPCDPRSISSLSCLGSSRKEHKGARVPSWQSYDALIKNYHPSTTKGALAHHSLSSSFPASLPLPPSSSFLNLLFLFFFFSTLRLLIYLAVIPTKTKQAAAAEKTWQMN